MRDDYFNPDTYMVIDRVTGDEVPVQIFIKEASAGYWEKAFAKTLSEYIGVTGASTHKVLAYLVKNKTSNNLINGTVREIAKNCEVNPRTVSSLFVTLQKSGYLKLIRSGCYMLSPKIMRHGSNNKGAMLLRLWGDI